MTLSKENEPVGETRDVAILNEGSFKEFIASSDQPVLVQFSGEHCGPCQNASAAIEKRFLEELDGELTFARIEVAENPKTSAWYFVMGVPTFFIFAPREGEIGKPVHRWTGYLNEERFMESVNEAFDKISQLEE